MATGRWLGRDRLAVVAALVVPFVVCALAAAARSHIATTDAALILVLAVVVVAANGYRIAGVVCAVSAAVWFDVFLTVPYESLSIRHRVDLVTTLLLLLVGVAVSEIAVRARAQAALASRQEGYLSGIQAATEVVSAGGSATRLVHDVGDQLVTTLGLRSCVFEYGRAGGARARLRPDGEVVVDGRRWDVSRDGLPVDTDIELLVETGGHLRGRYRMTAAPDAHPTHTQRLVAVTLANQVGAALQ